MGMPRRGHFPARGGPNAPRLRPRYQPAPQTPPRGRIPRPVFAPAPAQANPPRSLPRPRTWAGPSAHGPPRTRAPPGVPRRTPPGYPPPPRPAAPPGGFRWFPAVRHCWPDFPGQLLAVWGNKWCLPELRSPRLPLPRWSVCVCGSIFFRTSHKGKGNTLGDRNLRIPHLPPRTATIPPGIGAYPQHTPAYHRGSLAGLGLTRLPGRGQCWGVGGLSAP